MAEPQENIQNNSNIQNNNIQSGSTFMDGNRTIDKVTFENEALRNFQGFFDTYKDNWSNKDQKAILDQYSKVMDAIHTGNMPGRAITGKFIINNEEGSGIDTRQGGPGEVIGYYLTQILNALPSKEEQRQPNNVQSQQNSPFINTNNLNPPVQQQNQPETPSTQPTEPTQPTPQKNPNSEITWEGYVDPSTPEFTKAAQLLAKGNGRDPSYYGQIKRVVSNGKNIYVGYSKPKQQIRPLGQINNMTPQQKAANRKVFENGAGGMQTEDWLRLGAMAQDIGALAASFVPGYGTAASGILGLTSMGTNLAADINDESMSGWDVAKNAAVNTGLAAIGLIPGGKAAGLAKYAKLVPKLIARANAIGLVFNSDVKKSLATLASHPSELTNHDLQNLSYFTSSILGGRRSHQDTKLQAKGNGISNMKQRVNETKELFTPLKNTKVATNITSRYQKTKAYVNGLRKKPAEGETRLNNAKKAAQEVKPEEKKINTEQQTKGEQFKREYEQKVNKWKEEHPTITKYAQKMHLKDNYEMAYGIHPTASNPAQNSSQTQQSNQQGNNQPSSTTQQNTAQQTQSNPQSTSQTQSQQTQSNPQSTPQTQQPKQTLEQRKQEQKRIGQISDSNRNLAHFRNVQKNKMSKEDLDRFDQLVALKKNKPKQFRSIQLRELRNIISKYQGNYSARSQAYTRLNRIRKAQKATQHTEQAASQVSSKSNKRTKRTTGSAPALVEKKGGRLELLLEFKKKGGIIKAQTGLEVRQYGYNTGIGLNNGTTWRGNIFNNYKDILLDNISKYGQKYVDYINERQDAHYGIYTSANNSGDWRKTAYWDPNDKVKDYQTEYNDGQYHNNFNQLGISKAAESGRYNLYGTRQRTSGDWGKENWKTDNLYSQITDDRRILGRRDTNSDDWDINSNDYKEWQKSLNDRGYEMYLDPQTHYYKLRPLSAQNNPQNENNSSNNENNNLENQCQLGSNLNWKNRLKVTEFVNKLRQYAPDIAEFGRMLYNNRATNKRIDKYLTHIQPNYINGYDLYRRVYGDYSTKSMYNDAAARVEQLGNRQALNTADQSVGYAAQLATQPQANENRAKGNLVDNENIRNTYEKALELAQQNIARRNAVATANSKEAHAVERERANIEATRDAGITNNWNNWMASVVNKMNIEKNKNDARQEYLDMLALGTPEYDITNDPVMQDYRIQYERAQEEGDSNKMSQLAKEIGQYRTYKINEARQKFAKKYADKYHLNYEYTPTWRPSIALSAKGGVLDVSKYAAKDNDRLIKSILKVIDNNVSLVRGLKQHREPQVKILK